MFDYKMVNLCKFVEAVNGRYIDMLLHSLEVHTLSQHPSLPKVCDKEPSKSCMSSAWNVFTDK